MRVDVVHSGRVPGVAANRREHRRFRYFMLFVGSCAELGDRKGADLLAIDGETVLGEAVRYAVKDLHSSSWPSDAFVAGDQRARGMFTPGRERIVGKIEAQGIVLIRCRAGEEPPFLVEEEDERIGLRAGKDVLDA